MAVFSFGFENLMTSHGHTLIKLLVIRYTVCHSHNNYGLFRQSHCFQWLYLNWILWKVLQTFSLKRSSQRAASVVQFMEWIINCICNFKSTTHLVPCPILKLHAWLLPEQYSTQFNYTAYGSYTHSMSGSQIWAVHNNSLFLRS